MMQTLAVAIGLVVVIVLGFALGPTLWKSFRNRGLQKSGIEAPARVVEMVDTGNRFNYNPQVRIDVEVQPEDGEPFPAALTVVLTPVDLQRLGPGTMVTVKYDPEDRSRIVLAKD